MLVFAGLVSAFRTAAVLRPLMKKEGSIMLYAAVLFFILYRKPDTAPAGQDTVYWLLPMLFSGCCAVVYKEQSVKNKMMYCFIFIWRVVTIKLPASANNSFLRGCCLQ
jgi:hypothetical protein